jgi:hypothetical protein
MTEDTLTKSGYDDSWEWFEEFRDENSDLVESVSPTRDISERERIEGYLKSPFKTPTDSDGEYEQTDFGALIGAYAEIGELMRATAIEVLAEQYLDFAHGRQLEHIGEEVDIERWDDESDDSLRRRVQAAFRAIISGGTIDDIRNSVAELIGVDLEENPDAVEIVETFEEPAHFDVEIDEDALEETDIPDDYVDEHIRQMKAAGVVYDEPEEPDWFEYHDDPESDEDERGETHGWGEGRFYVYYRDYWFDD